MKTKRNALALIMALLMCLAVMPVTPAMADKPILAPRTQSHYENFSTNYTLTGNGATDIVAVALAQVGMTGAQLGYTEGWCADFICDCAILANQSTAIPLYGGVEGLKNRIIEQGGIDTTNDPHVGDICFIDWSANKGYDHAEIVYSVSGSRISTVGGNSGSGSNLYEREVKKHDPLSSNVITCIVRPNYSSNSGWSVPSGYNENDYNKLIAFLETEDENGIKNGYKISDTYNPNDPESFSQYANYWHGYSYDNKNVVWHNIGGVLRLVAISLNYYNLFGTIDFSNCIYLEYCEIGTYDGMDVIGINLENCPRLEVFGCAGWGNYNLDVLIIPSQNLKFLTCYNLGLSTLNVSQNTSLESLSCWSNNLEELNLSNNRQLRELSCADNHFSTLDLSHCPSCTYVNCDNLTFLDLRGTITDMAFISDGNGTLGLYEGENDTYLCAYENEGYRFDGWYNDAGELMQYDDFHPWYNWQKGKVYHARFVEQVNGDINNDGLVNANDALILLRYSLGLISPWDMGDINFDAADVNGDGVVNANDALMILRAALGLITL